MKEMDVCVGTRYSGFRLLSCSDASNGSKEMIRGSEGACITLHM